MDVAEKNEKKLRRQMRTTSKILLGFLLAILTGAVLLTLPVATVSGKSDFLTALFTATTSVCVTGLVVVPTFSYWTLFGKIVILALIQYNLSRHPPRRPLSRHGHCRRRSSYPSLYIVPCNNFSPFQ